MKIALNFRIALLTIGGAIALMDVSVRAEPIPQSGGATQVERSGDVFSITGGLTSADGQTLFHSFAEFGLTQEQVASFLAQPEVQSILSSVVGGEASYIDGLLQVTGSPADLYLINPAGILFGPNAQFDLAGSFAATTASGVLFDDALFNVLGPNDFSQLAGAPTGFVFGDGAGAVVNAADLSVLPGESITLMGGQVISTGTLTAPGGDITIAAIPDSNLVRISQADNLLSLELETVSDTAATALPFTPLTLSELLTGGGDLAAATGITTNPDGTITLVNTTIADVSGTAIATGTLDTTGFLGGDVTVVGDRVSLLDATVTASGDTGGGTVRIGGDLTGQPTLPGATLTYVDAGSAIAADALQTGDGGTVILWSDDTTGFFGGVAAQGGAAGGDGGFVEVSGARSLLFNGTVNTTAPLGTDGELLLDPTDIIIRTGDGDADDADLLETLLSNPIVPPTDLPFPTVIYEEDLEELSGDTAITLQASNSIIIEDLVDNTLIFRPRLPLLNELDDPVTELPDVIPTDPGPIRFVAGNDFIMAADDTLVAPGREVIIQAGGTVSAGNIATLRDGTSVDVAESPDGNITITGGTINAGILNALQAPSPLDEPILVNGQPVASAITGLGAGNVSKVTLTSTTGDIEVDAILAGAGGVVVNSARQFRAQGSFPVRTNENDGVGTDDEVVTPSIVVAIQDQVFGPPDEDGDPSVLDVIEVPINIQRGEAIAPSAAPGVQIAIDAFDEFAISRIDFLVGSDGLLSPDQSGTFSQILHVRPDRVVVTRFENQAFLFEGIITPSSGIVVQLENQSFVAGSSAASGDNSATPTGTGNSSTPTGTGNSTVPAETQNLTDTSQNSSRAFFRTAEDAQRILEICDGAAEAVDESCNEE